MYNLHNRNWLTYVPNWTPRGSLSVCNTEIRGKKPFQGAFGGVALVQKKCPVKLIGYRHREQWIGRIAVARRPLVTSAERSVGTETHR